MVAIEEPPVIVRILAHLGFSTRARPRAHPSPAIRVAGSGNLLHAVIVN